MHIRTTTSFFQNLRFVCRTGLARAATVLNLLERCFKNARLLLAVLGVGTLHGAGTLSYYQGVYDAEYLKNPTILDFMAASNLGDTYYTFQYPFGATLSMYEATKDEKYLQRALRWGQTMVAAAKITDKNGRQNWAGIWNSPYSTTPIAYMLEDLQGSTELARLARIILVSPTLKSTYGTQAISIYNFVRDHIVNKHLYWRSGGLAWFQKNVRRTDSAMSDKTALMLRILVDLKLAGAALDGADNITYTTYSAVLDELANGFKDRNGIKERFEAYRGGLIWDKGLSFEIPYESVDISHGNRHAFAVLELYRAGVVFTKYDVTGLANLLTKVLWNQSLADPMFSNFIDGSNGSYRGEGAWYNGMIYSGWAALAEFDAQTFTVVDAVLTALLNKKKNPSLNYMNTMWGRLSLAGHLAKAAAASPTPSTNNPPSAQDKTVTTSLDLAVNIGLSGTDPEGSALTFSVVSQPTRGILSGSAPNLTYAPSAGYNGSDSFTFKVNDGQLDSPASQISITVTAAASTPTSFVTGKVLGTLRSDYTGWVGMKFTVGGSPLIVTSLGRAYASGNIRTHKVMLVTASDGKAIVNGSVSIPMTRGTPGEFTYISLASPVTLSPYTSYYLVSQETKGRDQWYDCDSRVTTTSVGSVVGHAFSWAWWAPYNAYDGYPGRTYGPVDFKYVKSSNASVQSIHSSNSNSDSVLLDVVAGKLVIDRIPSSTASDADATGMTGSQDNKIELRVAGAPGQSFLLESSDNLTDWSEVRKVKVNGGTSSFEIVKEPGVRLRFYRARAVADETDR